MVWRATLCIYKKISQGHNVSVPHFSIRRSEGIRLLQQDHHSDIVLACTWQVGDRSITMQDKKDDTRSIRTMKGNFTLQNKDVEGMKRRKRGTLASDIQGSLTASVLKPWLGENSIAGTANVLRNALFLLSSLANSPIQYMFGKNRQTTWSTCQTLLSVYLETFSGLHTHKQSKRSGKQRPKITAEGISCEWTLWKESWKQLK